MNRFCTGVLLSGVLLLAAPGVQAHCDAIGGPVASAAIKALDTSNVNLVLRYVPTSAEAELTAAFKQARTVRVQGPDAKALADRYFMETAVRLHRAGEGAAFTGLKPAGTDFGPAIPAAEAAIASGNIDALLQLLTEEIRHGITERFEHVTALRSAPQEPATAAELPAARERTGAELGFIGYAEGIHLAVTKGGHAEGGVMVESDHPRFPAEAE